MTIKVAWVLVDDGDFPGRFLAANVATGARRMADDPASRAATRTLVTELNRQYQRHGTGMESAGRLLDPNEREMVWLVIGTDIEHPEKEERVTFRDKDDCARFLAAPWAETVRWTEPVCVMMGEAKLLDRPY